MAAAADAAGAARRVGGSGRRTGRGRHRLQVGLRLGGLGLGLRLGGGGALGGLGLGLLGAGPVAGLALGHDRGGCARRRRARRSPSTWRTRGGRRRTAVVAAGAAGAPDCDTSGSTDGGSSDGGRHAATGVAGQVGGDVVALGEARDHEQAHAAGGVGRGLGTVLEVAVELLELGRRHAQAGVGDRDGDALGALLGGQAHRLGRRREAERVVDQLGEQVDDVGRGLVTDAGAEVGEDLHALVVLHTGGRGLQRLADGEAELAGGTVRGVGQDQQRVGRTTHARGEVVEAEQRLEALGVLLVVLEALDLRELLVDQRGRAARERHEHRVDGLAELGLTGGEVDGLAVEVVDRSRDLADLLVGV